MFLEISELKSVIYAYQIEQITEDDDDIVYMAITAATDEAKSYLRPNNKKSWQDGRLQYDVDAVFAATGTARNSLLLEVIKNIAMFYIVRLCNVDMLYDPIKDRYDRGKAWLRELRDGETSLDLPLIAPPSDSDTTKQPFRFGSRSKFNHE